MQYALKVLSITLILMTQGCALFGKSSSGQIDHLVISEPLASNFESERKIDQYTQALFRKDITKEQRAQLYYERGVLFDSVGLRRLAHVDLSRALQVKPDLVDAYNFIGIQYTQLQLFTQAYESFDSAIELLPTHSYAYLNRGISLYYGGRPKLAAEDFRLFYRMQKQDPYRILWLYLAESRQDELVAKNSLRERGQLISDDTWAKQIISLYLGELSQQQFLKQLEQGVDSKKALIERLCEAYFYLGKYNQMQEQNARAANFFKLALSTNVYEFVEHRYAKLELDMM